MNNMKRLMALVMVLATVMIFVACTPADTDPSTDATTTAPTTTAPTTTASTAPEKKVTYRVKVVDEAGNPVVGAGVQLCKDACVIADTNEEGWAEFTKDVEDGYHANIAYGPEGFEIPEGKQLDMSEVDFASGETEMTLVLKLIDKAE